MATPSAAVTSLCYFADCCCYFYCCYNYCCHCCCYCWRFHSHYCCYQLQLHFRNLGGPNVAATPKVLVGALVVAIATAAVATRPTVARFGGLMLIVVVVAVLVLTANHCYNRQVSRAMPLAASKSTVAGGCNCLCSHCYYCC